MTLMPIARPDVRKRKRARGRSRGAERRYERSFEARWWKRFNDEAAALAALAGTAATPSEAPQPPTSLDGDGTDVHEQDFRRGPVDAADAEPSNERLTTPADDESCAVVDISRVLGASDELVATVRSADGQLHRVCTNKRAGNAAFREALWDFVVAHLAPHLPAGLEAATCPSS